jgi:hypothetical protein
VNRRQLDLTAAALGTAMQYALELGRPKALPTRVLLADRGAELTTATVAFEDPAAADGGLGRREFGLFLDRWRDGSWHVASELESYQVTDREFERTAWELKHDAHVEVLDVRRPG